MQANKDQDWTDDAAFWDEAWKDMNTRLDAKPARRKGGLAWWLLYLGIGATFLFALLMGAGIILDQDQAEDPPPPPPVIAKTPAGKDLGIDETKLVAADATGASIADNKEDPMSTPQVVKNETVSLKPVDQVSKSIPVRQLETADAILEPSTSVNRERISVTEELVEWEEVFPGGETEQTDNVNPSSAPGSVVDGQDKQAASLQLAPLPIAALVTNSAYSLPTVPLQRNNYPNPLTLDVGLTNSFHLKHPGFLAGISYRIKGGKKLSFPISLRYRVDEFKIQDASQGEAQQDGAVVTGDPAADNDEVLSLQSISTSSVEIGTGFALEATPRLRFSTGLSAAYQLRALVNFEGIRRTGFSNVIEDTGAREFYSLAFDRGAELVSAQSEDGISPDFSRWAFRANLGAAYDITPRLGVNLSVTRFLRQPDRAKVIGLQAGRIELGLSYRLR